MAEEREQGRDPEMQEIRETVGGLNRDVASLKEMMRDLSGTLRQLADKHHSGHGNESPRTGDTSGSHIAQEKETEKYRKLELPVFHGDDPLGWFFRIERYFNVNSVAEPQKLEAAIVCLEGRALNWYQWVEVRTPIRTWPEFKHELLCRFHPSQLGDEYEMLLVLKQVRSVLELVEEFEKLFAPLKEVPEECLVGAFKNALRPKIRAELRLTSALSLRDVMGMAVRIEERNDAIFSATQDAAHKAQSDRVGPKSDPAQTPPVPTRSHYTSTWVLHVTDTPRAPMSAASFTEHWPKQKATAKTSNAQPASGASSMGPSSRGGTSCILSDAKISRRRELGLCYKCAEKYSPHHVCKNKHLQVILMELDLEDDPGGSMTGAWGASFHSYLEDKVNFQGWVMLEPNPGQTCTRKHRTLQTYGNNAL